MLASRLPAQSSNGYFTAGLGVQQSKATSQFAAGGEWVARKGFGLGGELGVLAGHDSYGFILANGYYHFPSSAAAGRLDPFVTAGVGGTLELLGRAATLVSGGGGINYWFHRRLGLRLEMRAVVAPGQRFDSRHVWGFRAGMSFR